MENKTFIRITNQQIYAEILTIKSMISTTTHRSKRNTYAIGIIFSILGIIIAALIVA